MSYRIQISPEARSLLLTLRPHVVLRLARALAELAESVTSRGDGEPGELRVDGCVLHFVVDDARTLLEVIGIEQRDTALAAADALA